MKTADIDLGNMLFYVSLTIFVSLTFASNIGPVAATLQPFSYAALAALALTLVFKIRSYTAIELLALFALGAFSVYQSVECGNYSPMKFALLLPAMKGIRFVECIRYDLILRVVWTIALIALSYAGIAEDIVIYDAARGVRHSLGFSSANQLAMAVLIEVLEALYLMDFKFRLVPMIGFACVAIWLDAVTCSRASTIIVVIALMFATVNTFFPRITQEWRGFRLACIWAAPIMFALTWLLVFLYQQGNPIAVELDEMTTGRIWHIDVYTHLFAPTLFGSNLAPAEMTLDTLYAYLVYGYGVIITTVYLIVQPLLVKNLWERREHGLVIVLFVLTVYGLFERLWLCVEYDAFMLCFAAIIFNKNNFDISNNSVHKTFFCVDCLRY